MPPKRTPPKGKSPKNKTPKSKPKIIKPPIIRSRDSSVDSSGDGDASTSAATNPIVTPAIVGVSPDFMAYIQMQERIRAEEKATMEIQRREDIERAELDRHAQQKPMKFRFRCSKIS